jgi:hypothetical protein
MFHCSGHVLLLLLLWAAVVSYFYVVWVGTTYVYTIYGYFYVVSFFPKSDISSIFTLSSLWLPVHMRYVQVIYMKSTVSNKHAQNKDEMEQYVKNLIYFSRKH